MPLINYCVYKNLYGSNRADNPSTLPSDTFFLPCQAFLYPISPYSHSGHIRLTTLSNYGTSTLTRRLIMALKRVFLISIYDFV